MKDQNKKIKSYVVGAVIFILIFSRFVYLEISQNYKFTQGYFKQAWKVMQIKDEYKKFSLKQDDSNSFYSQGENDIALEYKNSVPVLVYHGIPYLDVPGQFNINVDSFKDHMFALKKAGYTPITTQELYKYLRKEIELPSKSILITFDDGRIDSVTLADPVLKALEYKATMFLIGKYSFLNERTQYYLSINQLKEMDKSGRWNIEAHSYDGHESLFTAPGIQEGHFFSHKQWLDSNNSLETDQEFAERITNDFQKVKSSIENLLQKPVESFAFPYGDFGQNNTNFNDAQNINLEKAKSFYSMMFYQTSPNQRFTNNYIIEKRTNDEFFLIKRIVVNPLWSGTELLNQLNKSTEKLLPYTDNFIQDNGWLLLWGNMSINQGFLDLKTDPEERGATIVLDGTRLWKNYSVKSSLISPNQRAVYLWVRFQDDDNNAACDFSNGFIHIEQTLNGNKSVIRGTIDKNIQIPAGEFKIEARVKDREIECILNNKFVLKSSFLDPAIDTGGIGFKAWDKDPNMANILIKKIIVEEYE